MYGNVFIDMILFYFLQHNVSKSCVTPNMTENECLSLHSVFAIFHMGTRLAIFYCNTKDIVHLLPQYNYAFVHLGYNTPSFIGLVYLLLTMNITSINLAQYLVFINIVTPFIILCGLAITFCYLCFAIIQEIVYPHISNIMKYKISSNIFPLTIKA